MALDLDVDVGPAQTRQSSPCLRYLPSVRPLCRPWRSCCCCCLFSQCRLSSLSISARACSVCVCKRFRGKGMLVTANLPVLFRCPVCVSVSASVPLSLPISVSVSLPVSPVHVLDGQNHRIQNVLPRHLCGVCVCVRACVCERACMYGVKNE